MHEIELYIIECIKNNKKPSGKKIASCGIEIDHKKLFCIANDMNPPLCEVCKTNEARFISMSKGFGKLCSKECNKIYMSNRNKKVNHELNTCKKESIKRKINDNIENILDDYDNMYTIKELSGKYNISYYALRNHLSDLNLTNNKHTEKRRLNLENQFFHINKLLSDKEWINQKIQDNWTGKDFAKELGCSADYVCSYLRKNGNPLVNTNKSSYENKIYNCIKSLGINNIIRNDRTIIPPKEIDIYLPEYKLAIEINGVYWHSIDKKDMNYHKDKTDSCNQNGIHLLHFFDTEIDNKFDIVKSIISKKLKFSNIIHANDCKITYPSKEEYDTFMKENYIFDDINAYICYGLRYKNEYVMMVGFNDNDEVTNICTKKYMKIINGIDIIIDRYVSDYSADRIIINNKRRLFTGKSFYGFDLINTTNPNKILIEKTLPEIYDCGYDIFQRRIKC